MPPKMADTGDTSDEEGVEEDEAAAGQEASEADPDSLLRDRLVAVQAKERLAALSDKCKLLRAENEKLTEEVVEAKSSLKDISAVLTTDLKAKTEQVTALERQLEEAVKDGERTRIVLERELADERASFQKEMAELRTRTEEAENKLREVRDFAERKGHLDEQLAQARAELARERKEHEEKLGELERHAVQDKDKLRREAAAKVKEAKAAMVALTESQLDTVTQQTIAENDAMSTELRYTAKRAEKLLAQNEKLTADNAALKRELDLSKTLAAELARKSCLSQKAVKLLAAKVEGQDELQKEEEEEMQHVTEQNYQLQARVDDLEQQLGAAQQDVAQLTAQSAAQASELEVASLYEDEAVHFLRACLADVREQIVAVTAGPAGVARDANPGVTQGGLDQLAWQQRQQALEYLFRKLAAYQAVKRGSWSQAPDVQYSFLSKRSEGGAASPGSMRTDPSISELLALSTPLTPSASGPGNVIFPGKAIVSPGRKEPAPPEAALHTRAPELHGRSRLGGGRDSTKQGATKSSTLVSASHFSKTSGLRISGGVGGLKMSA